MENIISYTLVSLDILGYCICPLKQNKLNGRYYRCDLELEAEEWGVQGVYEDHNLTLAHFKDQDAAHQFAELLTECLTKIKTFTDENI